MNQTLTKGPLVAPTSRTPRRAKRYALALKQTRIWAAQHRPWLTPEEQELQAHTWAAQYIEALARNRAWITQENPIDPMRNRMDDLARRLAQLRKSAVARGASGKEIRQLGGAQQLVRRMRRDYLEILHEALAAAHVDAVLRAGDRAEG